MKTNSLINRHIGVNEKELPEMLQAIGVNSLDELVQKTVPQHIRLKKDINLPKAMSEEEYAAHIYKLGCKNKPFKSYIGMGFYPAILPAVIHRNVFQNPVWYTSYTPYQAEISQGRLEALMNFQTVVSDLTGMPLANSSLLDEATAAAETVSMFFSLRSREQQKRGDNVVLVDANIFPQTLAVMRTRAVPQNIELRVQPVESFDFTNGVFACIVQYPDEKGAIAANYKKLVEDAHAAGVKVGVAADILSLVLLTPPGEWGADVVFGSTQRLGIPMFYGGPSAAYFATRAEYKRQVPGRIIGLSKDKYGKECYRMALQTREQHIKREKATSNICTAQALLATMAGFYAVYHGREGLESIAQNIHAAACSLNEVLPELGYEQLNTHFFDTLRIKVPQNVVVENLKAAALEEEVNLRYFENGEIGVSMSEATTLDDVNQLIRIFAKAAGRPAKELKEWAETVALPQELRRQSDFLTHEVFSRYRTETDMMRYIKQLDRKDISLAHAMIPLGSCTMKLNAASTLLPLSLPGWTNIHPFAPADQAQGYREMIDRLGEDLKEITGFAGVSFQPNSGAAGEYAGLRAIRSYLEQHGGAERDLVIIPSSAHGTNPASAVQAGYKPLICACDEQGNVDLDDMRAKINEHGSRIAALMITYPSTHGIFETEIMEICRMVHACGAQVYMDGANMNAQVGLTNPFTIGAVVCHLNLHKTFAIPHGGGGPGVGPICVAEHLVPYLPGHTILHNEHNQVAGTPYGSAGVLTITYGYVRMMGAEGLTQATKYAMLNANYLAARLKEDYCILFRGENGFVGHELIVDCREIRKETGISEADIAKRLMDYGYHAPTLSFPIHGTLMIEPPESESPEELNKFVKTMTQIKREIDEVHRGEADAEDNVLVNAPHPEYRIVSDQWTHPYSREKAAYPITEVRENKFWINVARADDALGDRVLISTRYGSFEEGK